MTYQPPGLSHDVQRERALMLCGAIVPVLCALEAAGLVGDSPSERMDLFHVDRIDNLVSFSRLTKGDGTLIDLRSDSPAVLASLELACISRPLAEVVSNLPGHAASRPRLPIQMSPEEAEEFRTAVTADNKGVDHWAGRRAGQVARQEPADTPFSHFAAARRTLYVQNILVLRQLRAFRGVAALIGL